MILSELQLKDNYKLYLAAQISFSSKYKRLLIYTNEFKRELLSILFSLQMLHANLYCLYQMEDTNQKTAFMMRLWRLDATKVINWTGLQEEPVNQIEDGQDENRLVSVKKIATTWI